MSSDGEFSAHEQLFLQKVSEASSRAAAKAVADALESSDKYADYFHGISADIHLAHHIAIQNANQNRSWEEIKKLLIVWALKGIILTALMGLVFWLRQIIMKGQL